MDCFIQFAAERLSIDREIEQALQHLRGLYSRRNEVSPVSALPPEIILGIFRMTSEEHLDPHYPYWEDPPPKSPVHNILTLTHVCRKWRIIALDEPCLWSRIPLMPLAVMRIWLEHARGSPLHLAFGDENGPNISRDANVSLLESAELAFQNMDSVQHIKVKASCDIAHSHASPLLRPAPLLQTLAWDAIYRSSTYEDTLPRGIFDGNCPRLHTVQLKRCCIAWDSPILTDLTDLVITDVSNLSLYQVHEVLHILERCPRLLSLELANAIHYVVDPVPSNLPLLHLPLLRSMRLCIHPVASLVLLEHISFPSTTNLRYKCGARGDPPEMLDLLDRLMLFARDESLVQKFAYLRLATDNGISFRFCTERIQEVFLDGCYELSPTISMDGQLVEICFPYGCNTITGTAAMLEMNKLVHLRDLSVFAGVASLYHGRSSQWTSKDWEMIAHACPYIDRLHAEGDCAVALLSLLAKLRRIGEKPVMQMAELAFPNLCRLSFESVHFERHGLLETMRTCIRRRGKYGSAIEEIAFESCRGIWTEVVAALKGTVRNVEWDGLTQLDFPYDIDEGGEEYSDDSQCSCHPSIEGDGTRVDDDDFW